MKLDDAKPAKKVKAVKKKVIVETIPDNAPTGFFEIKGYPSKGKLYPKSTQIFSRPLKILEVKQLTTIDESNFDSVINNVLSKTVKGIEIDELCPADKLFIIFWQRANTYKGDGFAVDFVCNKCNKESSYDFDVTNLVLSDIPDDYSLDKLITLPQSKHKIKARQIVVRDERLIKSFLENPETSSYDSDLLTVAAVIETVNGNVLSLKDKYLMLTEELSIIDSMHLMTVYKKNEISIEPTLEVECKTCGESAETPITFHPDFFLPEFKI